MIAIVVDGYMRTVYSGARVVLADAHAGSLIQHRVCSEACVALVESGASTDWWVDAAGILRAESERMP